MCACWIWMLSNDISKMICYIYFLLLGSISCNNWICWSRQGMQKKLSIHYVHNNNELYDKLYKDFSGHCTDFVQKN